MQQLGHLKTYTMKLTTLSPIFIGGGEFNDYSKLQYIIDKNKNELKFINEAKFTKFLRTRKKLDNFIEYVSKPQYNQKTPDLKKWIDDNFRHENLNTYDIYDRTEIIDSLENKPNCIKSFIKDSNNQPFIPGSSIKGAIATAILSHLIESSISEEEAKDKMKTQMNYMAVSDSKPLSTKELMYRQTKHQQLISDPKSVKKLGNLKIDRKLMNVDNDLKEILREGIVVRFNITLDDRFMYSMAELLDIIKNHYTKVLEENKILNNLSSKGNDLKTNIPVTNCPPNINIGGQSGFNTKVVLRALAKNDYMKRKKEELHKNFKKHGHLNALIAPRCLRVVRRYNKDRKWYMPLGWCNISIAE